MILKDNASTFFHVFSLSDNTFWNRYSIEGVHKTEVDRKRVHSKHRCISVCIWVFEDVRIFLAAAAGRVLRQMLRSLFRGTFFFCTFSRRRALMCSLMLGNRSDFSLTSELGRSELWPFDSNGRIPACRGNTVWERLTHVGLHHSTQFLIWVLCFTTGLNNMCHLILGIFSILWACFCLNLLFFYQLLMFLSLELINNQFCSLLLSRVWFKLLITHWIRCCLLKH